jgi:hypothetical protein
MKILLDCNAKVGREDILKPTVGNESLYKISSQSYITTDSQSVSH